MKLILTDNSGRQKLVFMYVSNLLIIFMRCYVTLWNISCCLCLTPAVDVFALSFVCSFADIDVTQLNISGADAMKLISMVLKIAWKNLTLLAAI